jgi:hypothetical protein
MTACLAIGATSAWGQSAPVPPDVGADAVLRDARGAVVPLSGILAAHRYTVIVFYSSSCPCFAAHIARIGQLARELGQRDVGFLAVDSERHGPGEPSSPAEAAPGLPLFRDAGGLLARRLNARYATQSFVVDRAGRVRYDGGIDSDRKSLTSAPRTYLRDTLVRLLATDGPRYASSKTLGCALKLF